MVLIGAPMSYSFLLKLWMCLWFFLSGSVIQQRLLLLMIHRRLYTVTWVFFKRLGCYHLQGLRLTLVL